MFFYNNFCYQSCPPETTNVQGVCTPCTSPCQTCETLVTKCTSCRPDTKKSLSGNVCLDDCPAGTRRQAARTGPRPLPLACPLR